MTAFIIAKYVERNKLKWNTKFFDLFPDWKATSNPAYFDITLQGLVDAQGNDSTIYRGTNDSIPDFKGTKQQKRVEFGKICFDFSPR